MNTYNHTFYDNTTKNENKIMQLKTGLQNIKKNLNYVVENLIRGHQI